MHLWGVKPSSETGNTCNESIKWKEMWELQRDWKFGAADLWVPRLRKNQQALRANFHSQSLLHGRGSNQTWLSGVTAHNIQAPLGHWEECPVWRVKGVQCSICCSVFLLGPPVRATLPGQRRLPRQRDGPGEPFLSGNAVRGTRASLWNMTPQLPPYCSFISTVSKL